MTPSFPSVRPAPPRPVGGRGSEEAVGPSPSATADSAGGSRLLGVGLAAMAASLLYSFEVTRVPLQDLSFFFIGPVSVAGTYYVQAAAVLAEPFPTWFPPESLPLASLPFAGYVAYRLSRASTSAGLLTMSPRTGQLLAVYSLLFAVGVNL